MRPETMHEAWTRYQRALAGRQHGGVAADRLIHDIGEALGRSQYEFQEMRFPGSLAVRISGDAMNFSGIDVGVTPTTSGERIAMAAAVAELVPDMDPKLGGQITLAVLGAFYRKRFGEAPGTVAVNGQHTAMRFYEPTTKSYRWAVHNPPGADKQQTTMCDTLPGVPADWTIHEKQWKDLI